MTMLSAVRYLLGSRTRPAHHKCVWAGEHDGGTICFIDIERQCLHVETDIPVCLAHLQVLLATGGVAQRPAPCRDAGCDVVSLARVSSTRDVPA